ncbi:hemolysin activation protein [Escherichia coli]|nr:hemolysin activation protein [Escherichia coli]MHF46125.1 hemolysin activation protein [Escherichia coli]
MIWPVFITVISGHDKSQPPGCLLGKNANGQVFQIIFHIA